MRPEDLQRARDAVAIREVDFLSFERMASDVLVAFAKQDTLANEADRNWTPDRYVAWQVHESMMQGPFVEETPDQNTFRTIALRVAWKGSCFSLGAGACSRLDEISDQWAEHPRTRGLTTAAGMRHRLLDWCYQVLFSGKHCSSVEFVLGRLRNEIDEYEVWIQLADIDVEDNFPMGQVDIRGISSGDIERWANAWPKAEMEQAVYDRVRSSLERDWLGHTAAVYRGIGDLDAIEAQAVEHSERACAAIRLVEPGNRSALQRSYLQPLTLDSQAGIRRVLANPYRVGLSETQTIVSNPPCGIVIRKKTFLQQWHEGKLRVLHEFLSLEAPSLFQQRLLRALLIYTRQRLTSDPIEKLIFSFSGLETILLGGDERVGIRFTLRKRLAAVFAGSDEYRQYINNIVKDAYDLRSGFLHHGNRPKEREKVELFLQHAWLFFWRILDQHEHWKTIEEYCAALDTAYGNRFGTVEADASKIVG